MSLYFKPYLEPQDYRSKDPFPVLPDPHYVPECEQPNRDRNGCLIVAWGDGWVDILRYTVLERITQ